MSAESAAPGALRDRADDVGPLAGAVGGAAPVLELDEVTKIYPSRPPLTALDRVSLSVLEGELVAVVGPSGSGKSTLLHLVGTLDRPTTGKVRVTGLDLAGLTDRELAWLRATRIGFVFQQFFLAEHATALENVADGLLYAGVVPPCGASGRLRRLPVSGSETSRRASNPAVGGRAAAGGDRPRAGRTAGDRAGRRAHRQPRQRHGTAILNLLEELNADGATIVVITHDRDVAARLPRRSRCSTGGSSSTRAAPPPPGLPVTWPAVPAARAVASPFRSPARGKEAAMTALAPRRLRPADLARVASVGLRTRRHARRLVGPGHRDRGRGHRGRARPVLLVPSRAAGRDRPAGHQPAHGHQRADPARPERPSCRRPPRR